MLKGHGPKWPNSRFIEQHVFKDTGLTLKQRLCADAYISNKKTNMTQAGRKAGCKSQGYAQRYASETLRLPQVREYMEKRIKDVEQKLGIDVEWKLQKLKDIADNNEDTKPNISISAIDMINKMDGDYAPEKIEAIDSREEKEAKDALNEAIEKNKREY